MATRLELQTKLEDILGSRNVYYQPPENVKIQYPCFIYSKEAPSTRNSNNKLYFFMDAYNIIYIDRNPDNEMTQKMFDNFSYIRTGAAYVTDNLNHYTFDIYF